MEETENKTSRIVLGRWKKRIYQGKVALVFG